MANKALVLTGRLTQNTLWYSSISSHVLPKLIFFDFFGMSVTYVRNGGANGDKYEGIVDMCKGTFSRLYRSHNVRPYTLFSSQNPLLARLRVLSHVPGRHLKSLVVKKNVRFIIAPNRLHVLRTPET